MINHCCGWQERSKGIVPTAARRTVLQHYYNIQRVTPNLTNNTYIFFEIVSFSVLLRVDSRGRFNCVRPDVQCRPRKTWEANLETELQVKALPSTWKSDMEICRSKLKTWTQKSDMKICRPKLEI